MDVNNLQTIRQSYANTVFTHKVQEVASEKQDKYTFITKIINLILVAFTLIFLVLQSLFMNSPIFSYVGIGFSIAEIIFLIIQLSFNFEEKGIQYKNSALKYLNLRDKYRNLITDIMNSKTSINEIKARRDLLQNEYQTICDLSLQTTRHEYEEAQKRLNKKGVISGEDFTWSDEEIDRFLPKGLRIGKIITNSGGKK